MAELGVRTVAIDAVNMGAEVKDMDTINYFMKRLSRSHCRSAFPASLFTFFYKFLFILTIQTAEFHFSLRPLSFFKSGLNLSQPSGVFND